MTFRKSSNIFPGKNYTEKSINQRCMLELVFFIKSTDPSITWEESSRPVEDSFNLFNWWGKTYLNYVGIFPGQRVLTIYTYTIYNKETTHLSSLFPVCGCNVTNCFELRLLCLHEVPTTEQNLTLSPLICSYQCYFPATGEDVQAVGNDCLVQECLFNYRFLIVL